MVGRFVHVLFDGSPIVKEKARKEIKDEKLIARINFFRVNDFYSHAQEYHKDLGSQINQKSRIADTARKIAILREENA